MFTRLAALERDGVIVRDDVWKRPNRWHLVAEDAQRQRAA